MSVRFGYACLALGVPGTGMRACTLRTAAPERLREIAAHNLDALVRLLRYNAENGIRVFRVSSDLIPFGSSPVNALHWEEECAARFRAAGEAAARGGIRLSMHPGQYTVLNSPDEDVVRRAAADLEYHGRVLRLLEAGPAGRIILHVGGAYGDKAAACERFLRGWERLSDGVRGRLALENDERSYNIADVVALAERLGIPAVFDALHHAVNPPPEGGTPAEWIARCAGTWGPEDGRQKIHYSQQSPGGKPGAHSRSIAVGEFLRFYRQIRGAELDVMLEVKDKNLSAVKCALAAADTRGAALGREWEKYRFSVLEHAPDTLPAFLPLLEGKAEHPAARFYTLLEGAASAPVVKENAAAAALCVWESLAASASPGEAKRFFAALSRYRAGGGSLARVKNLLYGLAEKYGERGLLESCYFL